MLALLFNVGPESYALPARVVVEVVPRVQLRPVPRAPAWLAGVFAYRGEVIPVVDLCRRLLDQPCPSRVSSRIVVVQQRGARTQRRYGVLAERVTEVRQLPEAEVDTRMADTPFVAATVLENGTLIQVLDLEATLPSETAASSAQAGD